MLWGRPGPFFEPVMITSRIDVPLTLPAGPPRSPGIHLSKVTRAIALESKILDEKWGKDLSLEEVSANGPEWWASQDRDSQVRMAIGMAWEAWYAPLLEGVAYQPGEMCLNGIFMTPDGESIDFLYGKKEEYELAIHELKTTSKSLRRMGNLSGEWLWLAQCKGYAKAQKALIVYLHVLFLCGDYSYPITPKLVCWRIEFTQDEIDESWEIVTGYVRHRQILEREDAGLEGGA